MRTGVVLLCRYSSSRLPGKIMMDVDGKPVIHYIVERIKAVVSSDRLCVATSEDPSDNIIETWCREHHITCFRGSLKNVAERFMNAFTFMGWDYAARINGDNFFVEMNVLKHLLEQAQTGKYDFLCNTHRKSFPQGMSVEIVRAAFYREVFLNFSSEEDFEHVTYYLHHHDIGERYYYENELLPEASKWKFAVDEAKDLELCRLIYSRFKNHHTLYNLDEIFPIYKQLQGEIPE